MVETKSLTVGYGKKTVLNDISVSFEPGQLSVIIGPNGSGKSSLIRTILGLQDKISGDILIDGNNADTLSGKQQALKMSYMAQSRPVPSITGRRMVLHGRFPYLSYPRKYRKEDFSAAENAIIQAGASDIADSFVPELSGGQRQKIYLAMILAQNAETVFMDEPTTYLDVEHQLQVMNTAKELSRSGKSVVLVLHDLCMALRYADRIILLDKGRMIMQGSPEDIFNSGLINNSFNIKLKRFMTADGWYYYYESAGN